MPTNSVNYSTHGTLKYSAYLLTTYVYELSIGTKIGDLNDLERRNGHYIALFH